MEAKIFTVLAVICLVALGIKLVMTEVVSIWELWSKLRGGEGRK
jgi:hypothetical protein